VASRYEAEEKRVPRHSCEAAAAGWDKPTGRHHFRIYAKTPLNPGVS
jgi:hypothetical protein